MSLQVGVPTVYCIGRHLLHREAPDDHVTGSDVTATSEVEGHLHATEAIASALAAAVLNEEEASSSESEEEDQWPAPMSSQEQHALHTAPVEDCSLVPDAITDRSACIVEQNGATSGQTSPQQNEVSSVEQHSEEKHLKLKSGKKRMMHGGESAPCDAVQDACLGREAITIEVLLGLLQDPDHGAHRAQVNKDVLIRKGGAYLYLHW